MRPPGIQGKAPYFANYVKQQLIDHYGSRRVLGGGLCVGRRSTSASRSGRTGSIAKWLDREDGPVGGAVALDPRDGRVLAMVGGENYRTSSQFNLAVQSQRQPGSAFKPFVLAAAPREGISPASVFVSKPVTIPLGDRLWPVRNYENAYLGSIDLVRATAASDNSVYAQLTRIVTPPRWRPWRTRLGVQSKLDDYFAIGLGAEAVNSSRSRAPTPRFANDGRRVDGSIFGNTPRAILSVDDKENRPVAKRCWGESNARYVNLILQRVVTGGTGQARGPAGRQVAGKTGTTENYGDAWFVGYTPQLVVAVWVGYRSELRPMLTEFHGEPSRAARSRR